MNRRDITLYYVADKVQICKACPYWILLYLVILINSNVYGKPWFILQIFK